MTPPAPVVCSWMQLCIVCARHNSKLGGLDDLVPLDVSVADPAYQGHFAGDQRRYRPGMSDNDGRNHMRIFGQVQHLAPFSCVQPSLCKSYPAASHAKIGGHEHKILRGQRCILVRPWSGRGGGNDHKTWGIVENVEI